MVLALIVAGLIAIMLSYYGVAVVRRWALNRNLIDLPNERSSHSQPTARGGGLAIVATTLIAIWSVSLMHKINVHLVSLSAYTIGAALIAVVSWADDIRSLPIWQRFPVHLLAATLVVLCSGQVSPVLPGYESLNTTWFVWLISVVWITGLTNAYNFMDGIDGVAGGHAVIAGFSFVLLGYLANTAVPIILGLFLASSSFGFLLHNWPPARIFMGDIGSAFLGYSFAVVIYWGTQTDNRFAIAGAMIMAPFISDTCFTFIRRLLRGENVFSAHRSHLYQRLVVSGHSHRTVTLIYMAWALLSSVAGILWYLKIPYGDVFLAVSTLLFFSSLWILTARTERKIRCGKDIKREM